MPALAQISANTIPQSPKPAKQYELRIFPGIDIPVKPDNYTWKTTLKFNGSDFGYTNIRVFLFGNGKRSKVGEIAPGTEVKLLTFRKGGTNIYYSVPYVHSPENGNTKDQVAWIQGAHIEATGKKASE